MRLLISKHFCKITIKKTSKELTFLWWNYFSLFRLQWCSDLYLPFKFLGVLSWKLEINNWEVSIYLCKWQSHYFLYFLSDKNDLFKVYIFVPTYLNKFYLPTLTVYMTYHPGLQVLWHLWYFIAKQYENTELFHGAPDYLKGLCMKKY